MDAVLNLTGSLIVLTLLIAAMWHFYWAAGGRIGLSVAVPEVEGRPLFTPGKAVTAGVGFSILGLATLFAHATNLVALAYLPSWMFFAVLGIAGLGLCVRAIGDGRTVGFTKTIRNTRFARLDSIAWSPLCLVIGVAAIVLAARNLFQG